MNYKMIFQTVGKVILIEAGLLLLPLITSLIYKESSSISILITIFFALGIGLCLTLLLKPKNRVIYAKEGFITVALAWISLSLIGAIPFTLSGEIPSYVDAVFETISGFTTTGASIVNDLTKLSFGLKMWRSFTQWIGGMGVLVFIIAIAPKNNDRSIHVLRAEMPGPVVDKITPRSKDTAKILYLIYVGLTVLLCALLAFGDMNLFESMTHAFATAGTGGFGITSESVGAYSPYSQWVIAIFMLLFATNFNLYFLLLIKRFKDVFKNTEFLTFIGIVITSTIIIVLNVYSSFATIEEAIRHSLFQVSSIISTAGFSSVDYNIWSSMAKTVLIILMFIGGSAGSTAGGLKINRLIILYKRIKSEIKRLLNPHSVNVISLDGKKVDDDIVKGVASYFSLYSIIIFVVLLLISFDGFDFETNFTATIACFNNVGPGMSLVGPLSNYSCYSTFSKIILSLSMLFGRLEIYPILLALAPATWFKK